MAYLLKRAFSVYRYSMQELRDPRVDGWFLMDSVFPMLLITFSYPYLVWRVGPALMKARKPLKVDGLLTLYNFAQILTNVYIVTTISGVAIRKFNFHCNAIDYSNDEDALKLLRALYVYFILKIVDLLDTVFFVLRKNNNQITFLHVYHHAVMIPGAWLFVRFLGGGQTFFIPMVNSFVHACMYSYYLISVWKKEYKKNSWLKRRITEIQLLQFALEIVVQTFTLITQCDYPKTLFYILYPQTIFFFLMFVEFYRKSYLRKPNESGNESKCKQ